LNQSSVPWSHRAQLNPEIEVPAAPPAGDTTLTRELLAMLIDEPGPSADELPSIRRALLSAALSTLRHDFDGASFIRDRLHCYLEGSERVRAAVDDIRSGKIKLLDLDPN